LHSGGRLAWSRLAIGSVLIPEDFHDEVQFTIRYIAGLQLPSLIDSAKALPYNDRRLNPFGLGNNR